MKHSYDILVTWEGKTRRSKMVVHGARWLVGKREHTQTPCGKDKAHFGVVDVYPVTPWHLSPNNPLPWCEKCRSALIARSDEMPLAPSCNTGAKLEAGDAHDSQ